MIEAVSVVNTPQQPLKKEARPGDDRAFEFTESNTGSTRWTVIYTRQTYRKHTD